MSTPQRLFSTVLAAAVLGIAVTGCTSFHSEERSFKRELALGRADVQAETYKRCLREKARNVADTHRPALQNPEAIVVLREQAMTECQFHLAALEKDLTDSDMFSSSFVRKRVDDARQAGHKQFIVEAFRSF